MELKDKLYNFRKKNGYTQADLAEKLEVSLQSISSWESGTIQPSASRLNKLSELYSVPLGTLLDDGMEIQRHSKDTKGTEEKNPEGQNTLSASREEDKSGRKRHLNKRLIVVAAIVVILLLAIGIFGYGIAATNAAKEKIPLEGLSNEEITVSSKNSFDLNF